jgi:hypothetical protein
MQAHRGPDDEPPTVRPPFDPAKFARDSERALRAEEAAADSARPTRPPPPALVPGVAGVGRSNPNGGAARHLEERPLEGGLDAGVESSQLLVSLSVEDDDVPFLAVTAERVRALPLSPLARAFLRHMNERDCVSVICARAGLRMDDAVLAIEELSGAGVVSFQRSTR